MNILAIRYITITFIILFIITVVLIITAISFRIRHKLRESYLNRKKQEYYPILFNYLGKRIKRPEIIQSIGKKNKDWDIFEDQIFELMTDLEGQEKESLILLLRIPALLGKHTRELHSRRKKKIVKACRYFEHIEFVHPRIVLRLVYLCRKGTQLESIAAASALTGSPNSEIRAKAVLILAKRMNISAMTILDVLYKFHDPGNNQLEEEGKSLEKIIQNDVIPVKNIAILIKGLADLNYIDQAPFIYHHYLEKKEWHNQPHYVEAVIYALGRFYYIDALDMIRAYVRHKYPMVRKASLMALARFSLPDDIELISHSLNDPDISVRLAVIKALKAYGKEGINKLREIGIYGGSDSDINTYVNKETI